MPTKPRRTCAQAAGWTPPERMRIEVFVQRGDLSMKAETSVADALNVSRLLVALVRQMAREAPDILPHADTVPGAVLPVFDEEGYESKAPRVGFRASER
jgi:hypothetical protein